MASDPSVLIIVPARFASTRFPGKPLALLRGADGKAKPLIQWSWEAAMRAEGSARVVVATDAPEIRDVAERFGAQVIMTNPIRRNGSERCAEALEKLGLEPGLVINLQGDSPLVQRGDIAALVTAWRQTGAPVLTPYVECGAATEARLLAEAAAGRAGGTTVVTDQEGRALYFSKRVIPYRVGVRPALKLHIGLYAYTPQALRRYAGWDPSPLEESEGLEQLRFLEHGVPIQTVRLEDTAREFWEVNHPEDVAPVEQALAALK